MKLHPSYICFILHESKKQNFILFIGKFYFQYSHELTVQSPNTLHDSENRPIICKLSLTSYDNGNFTSKSIDNLTGCIRKPHIYNFTSKRSMDKNRTLLDHCGVKCRTLIVG